MTTMPKPEFTHLELLAYTMYQLNNETKSNVSIRWWCMREDLRDKYMAKATKEYEQWAANERSQQENAASVRVKDPLFAKSRIPSSVPPRNSQKAEKQIVAIFYWDDFEKEEDFDSEEFARGFCQGLSFKGKPGWSGRLIPQDLNELQKDEPKLYEQVKHLG